jgi:hypothetical protein
VLEIGREGGEGKERERRRRRRKVPKVSHEKQKRWSKPLPLITYGHEKQRRKYG